MEMKVVQACMEAGHYAQAIRMLTGLLAAASEHDEPLSQSADGSRQDTSVPEALAELQSMLSRAETLLEEAYLKERNADALMQQAQVAIACMPAGSEGDAGGKTEEEGSREMGRGIFALRDFKAGEVIMEESPLAFAPRDMEHCSLCLRRLHEQAVPCPHCSKELYCSKECADKAWDAHHKLLCEGGQEDESLAEALRDFNALTREHSQCTRLLAHLSLEISHGGLPTEEALEQPNGLFSHLRHLCSADIATESFPPEFSILTYIFGQTNLASLVDEGFCFWLFTILMRNTFGLWIVDQAEVDKVYTDRQEDGVGLFLHASYFNHSCSPNVDRCNRSGDQRVTFVACADIKRGDQLFIEYVDTRTPIEERREELLQRYGFLCSCPKCNAEEASAQP